MNNNNMNTNQFGKNNIINISNNNNYYKTNNVNQTN